MNKFMLAGAGTLSFLALYAITYLIHIYYFRVDVVFYSAIFDGCIAAALCGVLLFASEIFKSLTILEKFLLISLWALVGYSVAISVPAVIDRSLSFYILEKIQQRGGGIRKDGFHDVFTKEYMYEHRLVDIRLTEQLESGTIYIKDGCVKLTARGEQLASFGRYFRKNLLPHHRLIMGRYSDDLTDPFRNSVQLVNYECH